MEMFLEGKVDNWYQSIKLEKLRLSWLEFSELLIERLSTKGSCDIVAVFNKLP